MVGGSSLSSFIPEGSSDINEQQRNEASQRDEGELKARKSLSDQLRENSKKKQLDYKKLTQQKNSFTRLSQADIEHINRSKMEEINDLKTTRAWMIAEENKRVRKAEGPKRDDDGEVPIPIPKVIKVKKSKALDTKTALGIINKRKSRKVSK